MNGIPPEVFDYLGAGGIGVVVGIGMSVYYHTRVLKMSVLPYREFVESALNVQEKLVERLEALHACLLDHDASVKETVREEVEKVGVRQE